MTAGPAPDTHLLRQLVLPARYEALVQRVGEEVAQLLVEPGGSTRDTLAAASVAARARGEGLFLPLVAASGTGKTTLTNNLATFLPNDFAATVIHTGEVVHDELVAAASDALPRPNDPRLVPINIDHREATPPTAGEVAEMKRFLREETVGSRCAIVWPQTSREQAEEMARAYVDVAGAQPVDLPVVAEGPPRETWRDTAINTLRLSNQMIDSLELIGVDPREYDPDAYNSIGEFLRQISDDFAGYLYDLLTEIRTPLRLMVVSPRSRPMPVCFPSSLLAPGTASSTRTRYWMRLRTA